MIYKAIDKKYDIFCKNILSYFDNDRNVTLFQKRNIVKVVLFEDKQYVVKSFKVPHIINKIVYRFFRDSKAKRSYENSVRLCELDVNTPKPIGYAEFGNFLFFGKSFYICDFFEYDFEIRAVFKDKNFNDRENVLKEFINFTYDLHQKGVFHVDYSPGNILVKKNAFGYEFAIIDVNRMKFLDLDVNLRMQNLSKLTFDECDNKLMMQCYSDISGFALEDIVNKYNFYLKEQKRYLDNKKKLKKIRN